MVQNQKNHRKMYENVLYFFLHAGALLLKIKKIDALVTQATVQVKDVDDEAKLQPANTQQVTRTRTEVKREAAEKAEALRGLVMELTTDDALKTALARAVSKSLNGDEAGFLAYCQAVVDGVASVDKNELDDAGFDQKILDVLVADLLALNESTGEALEMRTAAKGATDRLPALFTTVDETLTSLDRIVGFQRFAQDKLVSQYEALRVLPKTPTYHTFRRKGTTPYDVPQLLYNLLEEDVPTPTLSNTGGRGHEVVFYLGATAASRPRPGQGVLVKNGKKLALADYTPLGNPATEPFVLAMQTSQLAAGGWRVRG